MATSQRAAGFDWGNAKFSAALWEAPRDTRMVALADGRPFAPAAVRFDTDSRQHTLDARFPLADGDVYAADTLTFLEIKNKLPSYERQDVQRFVASAILSHWRPLLGSGSVRLGLSVPFEYSAAIRQTLRAAAADAGFEACEPVPEQLAAVLAYLPAWLQQPETLASLRAGACVWVVDCGALDLTVTIVHVRVEAKIVTVAYLATESIVGLGGADSPVHASKLELVPTTVAHLREVGFSMPWAHWHGAPPDDRKPAIVLPCGGGAALDSAVSAITTLLSAGTTVAREIRPAEAVARGCAVHAAINTGAFDHRVDTKRRMILGLRTSGKDGRSFSPLTVLKDEPPLQFDRAFSIDSDADTPMDISLAAAMPGGGRLAGVWSLVLTPERLKEFRQRVILVSGRLDTWSGGRVEVRDAGTGSVLGEGSFQLPT